MIGIDVRYMVSLLQSGRRRYVFPQPNTPGIPPEPVQIRLMQVA